MHRSSHAIARIVVFMGPLISFSALADDGDLILYALNEHTLFDGKFGPFADAQQAINDNLKKCGREGVKIDGVYGRATVDAIKALALCGVAPNGSSAKRGFVTTSLWKAIMPDRQPPSVEDRAQTLVLTYEATDYDRLEWNFCQNRPLWSPSKPSEPCYTNDPRSYITWGPRGATAGHGKEIQWIVARVDQTAPKAIDDAFGSLANDVRKLPQLNEASTRTFLCSIFVDEASRAQWTQSFAKFGSTPAVREAYRRHYSSLASDAAKMQSFYTLYRKLGMTPTEIDYGLFLDRATHSSPPHDLDRAVKDIKTKLQSSGGTITPANVRRAIAQVFQASNQTEDRLGRDVAYFIDATTVAGLTPRELAAWNTRGRLRASDVGLSDERSAPALVIAPTIKPPLFREDLTPMSSCPPSVMNPHEP